MSEPSAGPDPDEELARRVDENRKLASLRKLRYGQELAEGSAPASELAALARLETGLANLETYLRLRARHRARRALARGESVAESTSE